MSEENTANNGKKNDESTASDAADFHGLLFETSPYGNIDAIIQHDDRAVYFYLHGDEAFGTRACWVQNIIEGPLVINNEDLQQGLPPVMPRTHCRSPKGLPVPHAEDLKVVWFEEGSGAALFHDNELAAVIPPWSGIDDFHGYSAECISESPLAWPLPDHDQLRLRINNAYEFWQSCTSEASHPYALLQPQILAAFSKEFGEPTNYFSIDGGKFPPRGAAVFQHAGCRIITSIGMSLRPQPGAELAVEHPSEQRRIEMALVVATEKPIDEWQKVLQQFSGLVAWPWEGFTWFGEGHTCEIKALATTIAGHPTTLRFSDHTPEPLPKIRLPEYRGDPVKLLWIQP